MSKPVKFPRKRFCISTSSGALRLLQREPQLVSKCLVERKPVVHGSREQTAHECEQSTPFLSVSVFACPCYVGPKLFCPCPTACYCAMLLPSAVALCAFCLAKAAFPLSDCLLLRNASLPSDVALFSRWRCNLWAAKAGFPLEDNLLLRKASWPSGVALFSRRRCALLSFFRASRSTAGKAWLAG